MGRARLADRHDGLCGLHIPDVDASIEAGGGGHAVVEWVPS